MHSKNTSGVAIKLVAFPVDENMVMRGVIALMNDLSPILGKVATLRTSYVVLMVGMQPSIFRGGGMPDPVMAKMCQTTECLGQ